MDTFLTVSLGMFGIMLPAIALGVTLITGIGLYKLTRIIAGRVATLKHQLAAKATMATDSVRTSRTGRRGEAAAQVPTPNWALLAHCLILGSCTPNEAKE